MQQLRQHAAIAALDPVPPRTLSHGQARPSAANRHCDESPPRPRKGQNLASYFAKAASGARKCGSNFTAKSPGYATAAA